MKTLLPVALAALSLSSCDFKVEKSEPAGKTTVITPEKKVENNTTVVNPPKQETTVEKNTTIVNPPKP